MLNLKFRKGRLRQPSPPFSTNPVSLIAFRRATSRRMKDTIR